MIDEALRRELFRSAVRRPQGPGYDELLAWLRRRRAAARLAAAKVGLGEAMRQGFGDPAVTDERLQDRVAFLRITLREREVNSWCQPLMFDRREHLCGLLVRRAPEGFEALVQGVEEPGIVDGVQLGPTVQTDSLRSCPHAAGQAYSGLFSRRPRKSRLLYDVMLSEEGGRFFQDQKRFAAVLSEDEGPAEPAEGWRWAHVADLKRAIEATNVVNIFARTCLAILLY